MSKRKASRRVTITPLNNRVSYTTRRVTNQIEPYKGVISRNPPFIIGHIYLALRETNLLRIAQTLQALYLSGETNPSQEAIAKACGMTKRSITRNSEAIEIIKFALYRNKIISNTNVPNNVEHIDPLHMCCKDGDISYEGESFTRLNDTTWRYGSKIFTLNGNQLTLDGSTIDLPKKSSISTIERTALSLGLTIASEEEESLRLNLADLSFKDIMNTLSALALQELKVIPSTLSQAKRLTYGEHLYALYLLSISGSGRIKSTNNHLHWFNYRDAKQLKSKLFKTTDECYLAGSYSMKYEPTPLADEVMKRAIGFVDELEFVQSEDIAIEPLDILMQRELLPQIKFQDLATLFNECIGYKDGALIIRPTLTDMQHSRVYSCFTSISSDTRRKLGYINYDIGAALQTICQSLVKDPSIYPMHQELIDDKNAFRDKIMQEMGKDLAWVKTQLSKLDNEKEGIADKLQGTLQGYYQESMKLRKEIIALTQKNEQEIYNRAYEFAKDELKEVWNKSKGEYEFKATGRKKESSIFFFIWTQYERKIREAMMSCFKNPDACQQVHDAIYSKESIDIAFIEQKVEEQTSFKVKISH